MRDFSQDHHWLSVNTATARLAREVGAEALYEYARAFGFGCVTGIDLPGEVSGILRRPVHWSGRSLETIAIGQEVADRLDLHVVELDEVLDVTRALVTHADDADADGLHRRGGQPVARRCIERKSWGDEARADGTGTGKEEVAAIESGVHAQRYLLAPCTASHSPSTHLVAST